MAPYILFVILCLLMAFGALLFVQISDRKQSTSSTKSSV